MSEPKGSRPTSWSMYRALGRAYAGEELQAAVVDLLLRLTIEVEALRTALSSPEVPESVRDRYRQAYEEIAVRSHDATGPSGGEEKVLRSFYPMRPDAPPFFAEMSMLERLGAGEEERKAVAEKMAEVMTYT